MGTVIIATLQRGKGGTSPFPVSIPDDRKDAHVIVNTLTDRDNIEEWRRIARMTCYVTAEDSTYRLGTDITIAGQTWTGEGTASNYQLKSEKGQAEGYCPLNAEGYVDPIYVRSVYVQEAHVVNDEAERNALNVPTGDICHQLDNGQVYVKLNNDPPPLDNSDWANISSASEVTSVNGQVGEVSITISNLLQWSNNAQEFDDAVGGATKVNSNTSQINVNSSDIQAIYALLQDLESSPNTEIGIYDSGTQYEVGNQVLYDPGVGRYNYYRCHTAPVGVGTAPDNTEYWELIGDFYTRQEIDDMMADKADLVEGTVPLSQLPTNDLKGFYVVADLAERNTLSVNVDTRAIVLDATGDTRLPNGGLTEYLYKPSDPRADTEGWVWCSEDNDQAFDFERPIKRIPSLGKVPGGDTVTEGLENMFFGPTEPDIRANDLDLQEVGTTGSAHITGEVSKEDADTIDQIDYVRVSDETILDSDIPASPSATTQTLDYVCPSVAIVAGVSETYRVDVTYTVGGQQSKIAGDELPFEGVYPVLKGNTTDGLADLYTLDKLLVKEENIYTGVTGTERTYFAILELYSDLVDIQDQHSDSQFGSQFPASPSIVSVSSNGLVSDWTQNYKLYKSNYDVIANNERYGWLFNYEDETVGEETSSLNQEKLDSIEYGAEVNQTDAEIKTQYESNNDTNAYTDAEKSKLAGIEDGAEVNQDDAEIKTQYENNADTNAFTDAYKNKIDGIDPSGLGDMLKSDYDTDDNGIVDNSEKVTVDVLNLSGGAVTKGTVLYVNSYSEVQGVQAVVLADRTLNYAASGVALESIGDNAIGKMLIQGILDEMDTSTYTLDDTLYLDTAGTYTNVRPTSGLIQAVGVVSYPDLDNGIIYADLGNRVDAKVSADGSIDTHSDVDITTDPVEEGETLVWRTDEFVPEPIPLSPTLTRHIRVGSEGSDYATINEALDSITDNTSAIRYTIELGAEVHTLDNSAGAVALKDYVDIVSIGTRAATIQPSTPANDLFLGANFAYLVGIVFTGNTGSSYVLRHETVGVATVKDCVLRDCSNGFIANGLGANMEVANLSINNPLAVTTTNAIRFAGGSYGSAKSVLARFGSIVDTVIEVDGVGSTISAVDITSISANVTTVFKVHDGASMTGSVANIINGYDGFVVYGSDTTIRLDGYKAINLINDGFRLEGTGTGVDFSLYSGIVTGCGNYNYNVQNPNCIVTGTGFTELSKGYIEEGAGFYVSLIDITEDDEGVNILGELHVGRPDSGAESALGEGDSYTNGMLAYTETELGVFTDVTAEAKSASGSTFTFPGVVADNAVYLASTLESGGDFLTHHGVKTKLTAGDKGTGEIIAEYWDGAAWTQVNLMETESSGAYYPHAADIMDHTGSFHIRYDSRLVSSTWTKNDPMTLGTSYYWIRFRISTALTTSPTFEQFKLHSNRFEVNSDGWHEYFGTARPLGQSVLNFSARNPFEGNMQSQSIWINEDLGVGYTSNVFTAVTDRTGIAGFLPFDFDTSSPLRLQWAGMSVGAGTVEFQVLVGWVTDGDVYYTADPGLLPGRSEYTVSKTVVAGNVEMFEVEIGLQDMFSRRETSSFGDELFIALSPNTLSGNFRLTSSQAIYTKWCEGGHVI